MSAKARFRIAHHLVKLSPALNRNGIALLLLLPLFALMLSLPPAPAPPPPLSQPTSAAPTPPPPTPTPSGTVRVANLHHYIGNICDQQHGYRCFLGEVINDTPYTVNIQPPQILLLDAYGNQLAAESCPPFATTLLPGQRTPFVKPVSILRTFHSFAATVAWTPVFRLPVENAQLHPTSGFWRATGQIRNSLSFPLNALQVAVILWDSTERVIAIGHLRTHQGWTLPPGDTWSFSAVVGEWAADSAVAPAKWEIIASPFYDGT